MFFNFRILKESKQNILILLSLLFCIQIFGLYFRLQENFWLLEFWAEDGAIFFFEAVEKGISSFWKPYAGYYHAVPRIISYLSTFFTTLFAPIIFKLTSYGIIFLLSSYIILSDKSKLPLLLRFFLAITIVINAGGNEIYGTITNLQWVSNLLLFYILTIEEIDLRWYKILLIILLGLTGPFVIFLIPILFIRLYFEKEKKQILILLCACIFLAILQSMNYSQRIPRSDWSINTVEFVKVSFSKIIHTFSALFGGKLYFEKSYSHPQNKLFPILVFLLIPLIEQIRRREYRGAFCIAYGLLCLTAGFLGFKSFEIDHVTFSPYNDAISRYFSPPLIAFVWIFAFSNFEKEKTKTIYYSLFMFFLTIAIFIANNYHQPKDIYKQNNHWEKQVECITTQEICNFEINPPGWKFSLPSKLLK